MEIISPRTGNEKSLIKEGDRKEERKKKNGKWFPLMRNERKWGFNNRSESKRLKKKAREKERRKDKTEETPQNKENKRDLITSRRIEAKVERNHLIEVKKKKDSE